MSSRLDRLRAKLVENKLDGLVVSRTEDQRYLAGFAGHADFDSVMFVSAADTRIATDSRYWEKVKEVAPELTLEQLKRGEYEIGDALADFGKSNQLKVIGFEGQHVPYSCVRDWQKAGRKAGLKLKATDDLVKWLRAVKDSDELAAIRRAVQLTDQAFAFFCGRVKPGMNEKQAAWLIETFFREHGGERLAFDSIIASGPNAALPHAEPTERPIGTGEPITIDIGVRLDGYCSDLTRTITIGEPDVKFREIYAIVLKAQQAVERKARAGMTGKQVDHLARRVIENAGYGDNFGHGTGHGVGLAIHEFPRAGKTFKDRLEPNMTLTIEPGIYLPGWGGVRIEDLSVIQSNGVEILTKASKEPQIELASG